MFVILKPVREDLARQHGDAHCVDARVCNTSSTEAVHWTPCALILQYAVLLLITSSIIKSTKIQFIVNSKCSEVLVEHGQRLRVDVVLCVRPKHSCCSLYT